MGIKEQYSSWSLSRQIQLNFTLSAFFLTAIIVIITQFQLEWLQNDMNTWSAEVLKNNLLNQMEALGYTSASYISLEFRDYINVVNTIKDIDRAVLGFTNTSCAIKSSSPVQSNTYSANTLDYTTGAFYSQYSSLSSDGINLENKDAAMDQIYPMLYSSDFTGIYQGYYTDEIIHYYPGTLFTTTSTTSYTPLVREWFYKAANAPYQVIITEPYPDAGTGMWVVTVSIAILDDKQAVYGVAGVDITLELLTQKISNITILENGFAMLVSLEGTILTMPQSWGSQTNIKIYQEDYTGISSQLWSSMQNSSNGDQFAFTNHNGTDYFLKIYQVTPFINSGNITHYLLLLANKTDMQVPLNALNSSYQSMYNVVFWFVLGVAIVMLTTALILIYFVCKVVSNQLGFIDKLFIKIIRRALFPNIIKGTKTKRISDNSNGIERLVDSCKDKIENITIKEKTFDYHRWGLTRPNDVVLYSNWDQQLYPFNKNNEKKMTWRPAIFHLDKALVKD